MTQILTGAHALISGALNLAVLAEMISAITYEQLLESSPNTKITQQQFEDFMGEMVPNFVDAGLLSQDLEPTYKLAVPSCVFGPQ